MSRVTPHPFMKPEQVGWRPSRPTARFAWVAFVGAVIAGLGASWIVAWRDQFIGSALTLMGAAFVLTLVALWQATERNE